jgi:hypothetical protein
MRERARDLGIVLDEHLVRDAERARTELDTLSQVGSANLTRAALEAAPVIADLSNWLADVAGKAGITWERLFDAPEEKSLRTLRYELDLASSTIEKLAGRIRELREAPTLGFTTFIDTAQINALERKLEELRRVRDQTQARIAFLEGPPDTGAPPPTSAPAPDDTAGVQDRAKSLDRIARELEGTLFNITHEGSERIIAEHERRIAEIGALRARDGSNAQDVDRLIAQSAAVRDAQLSQLRAKEAAEKVRAANERVVASLEAEREALAQTERERVVGQALSRLSAETTAQQRREVEQLAGALFEEQQALQARRRLMDEGRSVTERTRTATEQYAAEVSKLNELLAAGAIKPPMPAPLRTPTTNCSARARNGPMARRGSCRTMSPRPRMQPPPPNGPLRVLSAVPRMRSSALRPRAGSRSRALPLRALLWRVWRRLARRHGRPLERQSPRHALAKDGCRASRTAPGGHHCGRVERTLLRPRPDEWAGGSARWPCQPASWRS